MRRGLSKFGSVKKIRKTAVGILAVEAPLETMLYLLGIEHFLPILILIYFLYEHVTLDRRA